MRTSPQELGPALEAVGLPSTKAIEVGRTRRRTSEEVIAASKDPDLAEYLRKRSFGPEGTTEPPPGGAEGEGNSFVIHKHRATRLHYDVRLERDGALPSWAVPRGLPTQPGDKRLAVRTEDHPLEYGSFQGTIPEGHYGAGEVRIFDDGWYEPVEWTDSKVSFRLHGRRYPGLEFHFVKTRTDWLAFLASHQEAPLIPSPAAFPPMLAEGGWKAFDDDAWWFEPKFDGIRSITPIATDATHLVTRNGRDVTDKYPELKMIHELVDQVNAVLDAEIVAFDEDGKNSFEALQQRMNLSNEREIKRISSKIPVALVAFDLLWLDGHDLTGLALEERRELLETIVEQDHRLQVVTHVEGGGKAFAEVARELGLEGVVAKRTGSKYQPGRRSPDWRKIKLTNTQDCVILGWTPGQGGRSGTFGALLVGAYDDGELIWIGQVGTGFTRDDAGPHPRGARAARSVRRRRSTIPSSPRSRARRSSSPSSSARSSTWRSPRARRRCARPRSRASATTSRPTSASWSALAGVEQVAVRRVRTPRARASRGPRARPGRGRRAPCRRGPPRTTGRTSGRTGSEHRPASRTRGTA